MKPGYKQTEVGVIPEDWEVPQIRSVCRLINGRGFKPHEWQTAGLPIIRIQNLNGSDEFNYYSGQFNPKILVEHGQLLFAWSGSRGTSFGPHIWYGGRALLNYHTWKVAVYETAINTRFFFHALRHLTAKIEDKAHGASALVHTQKGEMEQFQIPIPPTDTEQRAIADALSDVDGLLGGLDRLIAKKRDLKQAAMQQLLTGQTRLPGFHGEWEVKTLFDLAGRKKELFDDGDWIESEHIKTEGIRLIQTGNIGVGSFIEKGDKKYINEASFSSLRCKQLMRGDLLVCRLAEPAGRCCVLPNIGEERVVTSVDVTIFRPPQELADRRFLCQVFSTPDWFKAVSDRSGGTTHKRISRGALGRLSINLPRVPEQTAIAEILSDMDAELTALEQRREKTLALKQAMMQELLTGRTRLV